MATYELLGLADNYSGAKSTLTHLRPVLIQFPDPVVPTRDEWKASDLRPVTHRDTDHITPLSRDAARDGDPIRLGEGDWIWVAGPDFIRASGAVPDLDEHTEEMELQWEPLDGGFRYSWGTIESITEYARSIYTLAKRALWRELFAPEGELSLAKFAFAVLDNIHYAHETDKCITQGTYLRRTQDADRYRVLREQVALDRLFASPADFDHRVTEEINWHAGSGTGRRTDSKKRRAAQNAQQQPLMLENNVELLPEGWSTLQGVISKIQSDFESSAGRK